MFAFFTDELEAKNRSKLCFTARIIIKYSLERFLSICGEKMSKGFLKFCKLISTPDDDRIVSHDAPCFMLYYHGVLFINFY